MVTPTVSVVMVSYHTGSCLFESIHAVLQDPSVTDCILVNNGNPDDVMHRLESLASEHPTLKLITGHGNVGFSKGCNLGAYHATSDYIFLLNPDAMIRPNTIANLTSALESHPDAWVAGCSILDSNGQYQYQAHRNLLSLKTAIGESLGLGKLFPRFRLNNAPVLAAPLLSYVPALSGACMMIRLSTYQQLHGMDEDYFLHVEDLDFCYRVNRLGGKLLYVPTTSIMHIGATSDTPSKTIEGYKRDSLIIYFKKYPDTCYGTIGLLVITGLIRLRYYLKIILKPMST